MTLDRRRLLRWAGGTALDADNDGTACEELP